MSSRATFKQADLTRAIRGVRAAGVEPRTCRINHAGDIELTFEDAPSTQINTFDKILGAKPK